MKRIIIPLCLMLIISFAPTRAVFAETTSNLAKPIGRECYFFSEKDLSTALFAVPYSYCIQIIRNDGEWLYVSYAADEGDYKKIYGFCKSNEFERVSSPPKHLYLNKTVTITYTAGGGQGSLNPPSDLLVEAAYYGGYRQGANVYSYVLCRGSFCYIEGDNDDYPLNEYEKQTTESQTGGGVKAQTSSTTGLIIFIVILAVALVALGGLAFTSKRQPPQ